MKTTTTVLAALIALAAAPVEAKGIVTGNDLYRACSRYLNSDRNATAEDGIEQGQCLGMVYGIYYYGQALPETRGSARRKAAMPGKPFGSSLRR